MKNLQHPSAQTQVAMLNQKNSVKLLKTFEAFDRPKGIYAGMGTTGIGISQNHLHLAYQRYGREGVISEMSGDCIRVTKSKSIFYSIADFFRSEQ